MTGKKEEIDRSVKEKLAPKQFTKTPINGTKFTILVSSAKGGVGKSTVTALLALAYASKGKKVGIVDADIWGYSIPKILGAKFPPIPFSNRIFPSKINDLNVISMEYFVKQDEAVIWRGPMLHKAIEQFLFEVIWEELELDVQNITVEEWTEKCYTDLFAEFSPIGQEPDYFVTTKNNILDEKKYLKKDNLWIINTTNKDIYSNIIICEKDSEDFFKGLNISELDFNISKFIDIINCFLRINKLNKERYIPQVLNLDENNGINFKKGCYTGQEIIARTHYLGKVKKKIFIIKHTSSKIDINDKIYDGNDESVGEVISDNIILNNEYYCLGVIKTNSIKSSIFSKKESLFILN